MTEAIRQGDIPGVQLRCRQALEQPPEVAWSYLVEPRRLEDWLCRTVGSEGKEMRWHEAPAFEGATVEVARILASEPPARLLASLSQPGWPAGTRLEIELTPTESGCEASVLHNGFEHLPLSDSLTVWEAYRRRWRGALQRLAQRVRDGG